MSWYGWLASGFISGMGYTGLVFWLTRRLRSATLPVETGDRHR